MTDLAKNTDPMSKAIISGANLLGLKYDVPLVSQLVNFVTTNFSGITPLQVYNACESAALTGVTFGSYRISGSILTRVLQHTLEQQFLNKAKTDVLTLKEASWYIVSTLSLNCSQEAVESFLEASTVTPNESIDIVHKFIHGQREVDRFVKRDILFLGGIINGNKKTRF